ncbi:hypothetical protein BaRGS_00029428, partial [Batillaria attramentaria]
MAAGPSSASINTGDNGCHTSRRTQEPPDPGFHNLRQTLVEAVDTDRAAVTPKIEMFPATPAA